mmetsp:Transcript_56857/g.144184  ORF Transcript_56857/g.144184 Transcript_56857/m.144184 type:complete len:162 (-) Transcript_56857:64-549(-)
MHGFRSRPHRLACRRRLWACPFARRPFSSPSSSMPSSSPGPRSRPRSRLDAWLWAAALRWRTAASWRCMRTGDISLATPEGLQGKLRVPDPSGRIHIDRSEMGQVLEGAAANYAEWLLFGRAAAVVLSRSFFGETAAEVGRVPAAYFAPNGGCVRTDLSSS